MKEQKPLPNWAKKIISIKNKKEPKAPKRTRHIKVHVNQEGLHHE